MAIRLNKARWAAIFLLFSLFSFIAYPLLGGKPEGDLSHAKLKEVIDGDTVLLSNNQSVRLIGIDTPEREEPYYQKAKTYLKERLTHQDIIFTPCTERPKDKYGRLLAMLSVNNEDMGAALLEKGLAL